MGRAKNLSHKSVSSQFQQPLEMETLTSEANTFTAILQMPTLTLRLCAYTLHIHVSWVFQCYNFVNAMEHFYWVTLILTMHRTIGNLQANGLTDY